MKNIDETLSVHKHRILCLDNVVGVGVGHKHVRGQSTGKKAIVVLVREKKPLSALSAAHAVPLSLEDHETDVIEIGHIALLSNTKRIRPVAPGHSVGHYLTTAGTFGCVVRDKATGKRLMLSNNHVFANTSDGKDGRCKVGDPILQPGKYDQGVEPEDVIARLERFVPIARSSAKPTCLIANAVETALNGAIRLIRPNYTLTLSKSSSVENLVDAALARPTSDSIIMDEITGIGVPRGLATAYPGMSVQKSGRSSGLTTGKVLTVGTTLSVSMGDLGDALFTDQIVTTGIGQPGDSGSLVLDDQRRAIGLLAAGSEKATICGSIANVLDLLGVSLVTA